MGSYRPCAEHVADVGVPPHLSYFFDCANKICFENRGAGKAVGLR